MVKRDLIKELGENRISLNIKDAEITVLKNGYFFEKIRSDIVDNYAEYNGKKYFVYQDAENIHGETKTGYCFWL